MKKLIIASCLIALIASAAPALWAQDENLSANRTWGVGVRFLPSALSPIAPYSADPALGTALALQYWMNDLLGLEAGGWFSSLQDAWSENSTTLIAGGLWIKLANTAQFDLYAAGRAINLNSVSKGRVFCPPPLGPRPTPTPENAIPPPPCWPWPGSESRTSTLAFELTAGIEGSLSSHVALDFEFGLIYAQSTTINLPPPPVPLPPEPVPPKPQQQPTETFASTSLNFILHMAIYFYF